MSTEKNTQAAILQYLNAKRIFAYRQNSGAFKTERGFYRFCSINGLPDVMAFSQGKAYAIECKDKQGRQSPAQKEFQTNFEKAGGIYVLARSIDDVMAIL